MRIISAAGGGEEEVGGGVGEATLRRSAAVPSPRRCQLRAGNERREAHFHRPLAPITVTEVINKEEKMHFFKKLVYRICVFVLLWLLNGYCLAKFFSRPVFLTSGQIEWNSW